MSTEIKASELLEDAPPLLKALALFTKGTFFDLSDTSFIVEDNGEVSTKISKEGADFLLKDNGRAEMKVHK